MSWAELDLHPELVQGLEGSLAWGAPNAMQRALLSGPAREKGAIAPDGPGKRGAFAVAAVQAVLERREANKAKPQSMRTKSGGKARNQDASASELIKGPRRSRVKKDRVKRVGISVEPHPTPGMTRSVTVETQEGTMEGNDPGSELNQNPASSSTSHHRSIRPRRRRSSGSLIRGLVDSMSALRRPSRSHSIGAVINRSRTSSSARSQAGTSGMTRQDTVAQLNLFPEGGESGGATTGSRSVVGGASIMSSVFETAAAFRDRFPDALPSLGGNDSVVVSKSRVRSASNVAQGRSLSEPRVTPTPPPLLRTMRDGYSSSSSSSSSSEESYNESSEEEEEEGDVDERLQVAVDAEGTSVVVLAPSKSKAMALGRVLGQVAGAAADSGMLRVGTFVGGGAIGSDIEEARNVHIAVGTPGRMAHLVTVGALVASKATLVIMDDVGSLLGPSGGAAVETVLTSIEAQRMLGVGVGNPPPKLLARRLYRHAREAVVLDEADVFDVEEDDGSDGEGAEVAGEGSAPAYGGWEDVPVSQAPPSFVYGDSRSEINLLREDAPGPEEAVTTAYYESFPTAQAGSAQPEGNDALAAQRAWEWGVYWLYVSWAQAQQEATSTPAP